MQIGQHLNIILEQRKSNIQVFCRFTRFMALMHTRAQKFKRTHVSCSRQHCWCTLPSRHDNLSGSFRWSQNASVNRTPGGFMITITLNNSWQRLIAWSRTRCTNATFQWNCAGVGINVRLGNLTNRKFH